MITSPSFTTIADWVEGRLDDDAASVVEQALKAGDARTTNAVQWLRTFRAVSAELPLKAPPVRVRYYLRHRFDERTQRPAERGAVARRLLAALVFDSRTEVAAAGVRAGDVDTETVHLAFRSDVGDVLLDLTPTGDSALRIDGQMLWADGHGESSLDVVLEVPGHGTRTVSGDDLGRFSFTQVPSLVDRILLRSRHADIRLTWSSGLSS